jgi:hypothetical protein
LAGCRSRLEAGINLKSGSFRQNGKIATSLERPKILGTGVNWAPSNPR